MYTIETARHEANIAARAARLFTTEGYTFRKFATCDTVFSVMPADKTKLGYIVDVEFHTCSCKGHELNGICSHRLAIEEIVREDARALQLEAENEEREAGYYDLLAGKF